MTVVVAVVATGWIVVRDRGDDGLSGPCADVHEGHATAMWDPTMADEMTESGCPWPYEPFVPESVDGDSDGSGSDAPASDAPFEAHLYADVWTAISGSEVGVCQVAARTDGSVPGRAFGFAYEIAPNGCPDGVAVGVIVVDEFATEADRDAAARVTADQWPALVLGRWVIGLEGDAEAVRPALEDLGAQPVG